MFHMYVVLLAFSGIVMLVLAWQTNGQGGLTRALNLIFGIAFVGYACYLAFFYDGGSYLIFFKAFILPVVMVLNFYRNRTPRTKLKTQP